jgi:hypothetical protein
VTDRGGRELGPAGDAELAEDAGQVGRHRAPGNEHAGRDLRVGQTLLRAGRGAEPALVARLVTRLAAGHADQLSGCHLSVHDDLDAILACGQDGRDHYQLRLRGREHPSEQTSCY